MNKPLLSRDLDHAIDASEALSPEQFADLRAFLSTTQLSENFERSVTHDMHGKIVMQERLSDFETVWQYGRLLDNMGRTEDAIAYLEMATDLAPENPKALARLANAFLDLHQQMPNRGYGTEALEASTRLLALEDSDYTRAINASATYTTGEGERKCERVEYAFA